MELIPISQKAIQPGASSEPQAPGARVSHPVSAPEPASFGDVPALGGAEKDTLRPALHLL